MHAPVVFSVRHFLYVKLSKKVSRSKNTGDAWR